MYYNICAYNTMALLLLYGTAVQFIYRALLVLTHCSTVLYIPANSRYDLLHLINQSINKQINGQMISCAFFSLSLFFFLPFGLVSFFPFFLFFSKYQTEPFTPPPSSPDLKIGPNSQNTRVKKERMKKKKRKKKNSKQADKVECHVT